MSLDGFPVVRANLYVYAYDPSLLHRLAQAGVKDERAAVRHSCFDNHVRLYRKQNLLDANHVFGQLNDGPAEPGEAVNILGVPARAQPCPGDDIEGFRRAYAVSEASGRALDYNLAAFNINGDLFLRI